MSTLRSVVPASMKIYYDSFHFSPAVIDGREIRCSGMLGVDLSSGAPNVPEDPETQFRLAFEAVREVLTEAGASLADITEMTSFHIDMNDHMGAFMKVKDEFISEPYPAWTAVGTTALAMRGALVEIRVQARLPE